MKKLVLTMIAMVTMSLSAMAQDTAQVRRQFNPEQMAKMRTDAVVQKSNICWRSTDMFWWTAYAGRQTSENEPR